MGPFPPSCGYLYILLTFDYVSKWVVAIPTRTNDHKVVLKFLKEHIFSHFGMPRAIISDGGLHLSRPDSRSNPIGESEPISGCETIYWYSLPNFFFQSLTYTCGYTNNFCNN